MMEWSITSTVLVYIAHIRHFDRFQNVFGIEQRYIIRSIRFTSKSHEISGLGEIFRSDTNTARHFPDVIKTITYRTR